jgi:hypothetical protein
MTMSAAAIFASQFVNDRAAVPLSRRVTSTFGMIALMLAGAWPETRVVRPRPAGGTGPG